MINAHPKIQNEAYNFFHLNLLNNPFLYVTMKRKILDFKKYMHNLMNYRVLPKLQSFQKQMQESNK